MESKKICFIILYHNTISTKLLRLYIENIKRDINDAYDIDYFLVGDSVETADHIFNYPDVYTDMGYNLTGLSLGKEDNYIGRSIFPILDFYKSHNNYDKYFIIEYDLYYTGNFKTFMDNINLNDDTDVIMQKPFYGVTNWYWYESEKYYCSHNLPGHEENAFSYFEGQNFVMAHGYFHIYIVSNKALKYIDDTISYLYAIDNRIINNMHYEALVPIILLNNRRLISHVGVNSPLTISFFEDIYKDPVYYFTWKYSHNTIQKYLKLDNALLHPVKNYDLYDQLYKK